MKSLKSILAVVIATVGLVSCTSVQRQPYTVEQIDSTVVWHLQDYDLMVTNEIQDSITFSQLWDCQCSFSLCVENVEKELNGQFVQDGDNSVIADCDCKEHIADGNKYIFTFEVWVGDDRYEVKAYQSASDTYLINKTLL